REDGTTVPLPKPSIDTGAGLERLLAVLQQVDSVWDTDEFVRLLGTAPSPAKRAYGSGDGPASARAATSMRILADHARSTTFLINDGVFPSNEDRGYVLRRIMRRAIRHAYLLGIEQLVLPEMVDSVVEVMGDDYPELVKNHGFIRDVVAREEERFRRTLATGSTMLDAQLEQVPEGGELPGDVAFQLPD